ncbi:RNase H [Popillia japonica]|uniref:ribonuclease H n=1 Tax=Popillia japonica TaxID=7064 RepID=A0AAW1KQ17_POPJA
MSDRLACYSLKPAEIFDSPEILINGHFNKASANNQQYFLDLLRTNSSHCTEFYTDGSLFNDPARVGYGVFCPKLNISEKGALNMLSNIFEAEIFAVYKVLSLCQSFHIVNVVIFVDSQAAIRGLCELGYSAGLHPLIADCRRIIYQIKETGNVTLVWVPGHKSIFGNEKANLLAIDGSSEEIRYNKIFSLEYRRKKDYRISA